MTALLLFLLTLPPTAPAPQVNALFAKVGPTPVAPRRPANQNRAVVLIHGLSISLISTDRITAARLRAWQQSDSILVRRLAKDSDVFSFAYAQTAAVEKISEAGHLSGYIRTLKTMGYREIVLVGHSAGGLIARQLVEDQPSLGVTRVVQVCAPNGGSPWASLRTARPVQIEYLSSLTKAARTKHIEERAGRTIPAGVEFACIVGACRIGGGDGVVPFRSQWSNELRAQGVPAYLLQTTHWDAVRTTRAADLIARLVTQPQPRWDAVKVKAAAKELLGE